MQGAYRQHVWHRSVGIKDLLLQCPGFRGEEFDPASPVKLFVCGCSYTFGTGLDLEESWSFLFSRSSPSTVDCLSRPSI